MFVTTKLDCWPTRLYFCCSHWWGAIGGHRAFESLRANILDVGSWSDVLFYPSEADGFFITLPLPLTHLEPQQDRPTWKSLKIWRNWRPRLLKTIRFDGLTNKSSCNQKPSAFQKRSPFYTTTATNMCNITSYAWSTFSNSIVTLQQ